MIGSTIRFVVARQHREAILDALQALGTRARALPGCFQWRISQDVEDENRLYVVGLWLEQQSFEAHVRSADYRRLLELVDLASEPPVILVLKDVVEGFPYIESVRQTDASGEPEAS